MSAASDNRGDAVDQLYVKHHGPARPGRKCNSWWKSDRRLQRPYRYAVLDNVGTCQKAKLATGFSRAALNYRIEK